MRFWSGDSIGKPKGLHSNIRLVVSTNTEGRHGFGVAKIGRDFWGAKYGQSRGISGRCYLLVTKNLTSGVTENGITYPKSGYKSLTLSQIRANIEEMYVTAKSVNHQSEFWIVPYIENSRLLNGYTPFEIFSQFVVDIEVPKNIVFHNSWKKYFQRDGSLNKKFWD